MAQTTKSANQDAQSGGSFKITSGANELSKSPIDCVELCTKVPKSPAWTFFISAPRLIMLPQRVIKIWFTTSPKTEGMKKMPSNAALAITRHFTSAETACDSSASSRIQTTLPTKIALASERLFTNQPAP